MLEWIDIYLKKMRELKLVCDVSNIVDDFITECRGNLDPIRDIENCVFGRFSKNINEVVKRYKKHGFTQEIILNKFNEILDLRCPRSRVILGIIGPYLDNSILNKLTALIIPNSDVNYVELVETLCMHEVNDPYYRSLELSKFFRELIIILQNLICFSKGSIVFEKYSSLFSDIHVMLLSLQTDDDIRNLCEIIAEDIDITLYCNKYNIDRNTLIKALVVYNINDASRFNELAMSLVDIDDTMTLEECITKSEESIKGLLDVVDKIRFTDSMHVNVIEFFIFTTMYSYPDKTNKIRFELNEFIKNIINILK